jgi:hypothetical protein
VDGDRAAGTSLGRSLLERSAAGDGWLAICLAADDLEAVARRLDLEVSRGSRERPDGGVVRWRSAGLEDPRREPWMPFFIEWDVPPELHPGRARAGHGVKARGIASVEVGGDAAALDVWLGGQELPIRVAGDPGGIHSVALATPEGELVIR